MRLLKFPPRKPAFGATRRVLRCSRCTSNGGWLEVWLPGERTPRLKRCPHRAQLPDDKQLAAGASAEEKEG